MKESLVKEYFDGEIGALSLKPFLAAIRGQSELVAGRNLFTDLDRSRTVTSRDLEKICHDYLAGIFDAADVEALAFFLMGSDHFIWDNGTRDGAVVAELIDDWNAPEIAFAIDERNIRIIARGLSEGIYDTNNLSLG